MFVGVARLTLQIPESGSLKAKRQVLRRVIDRVKARFNVAVAEVDEQDLWQKAVIGLAVVGNERRHVDEQLEKVIRHVEEMYVAPLTAREREILSFGDQLYPGGGSPEAGPAHAPAGAQQSGDELWAQLNRSERSLAEAEGMAEWERRHEERSPPPAAGRASGGRRGGAYSLDEARARARGLRRPRDWEKK
jgi:uncharacterized protein YlxP (DUF503 family)